MARTPLYEQKSPTSRYISVKPLNPAEQNEVGCKVGRYMKDQDENIFFRRTTTIGAGTYQLCKTELR